MAVVQQLSGGAGRVGGCDLSAMGTGVQDGACGYLRPSSACSLSSQHSPAPEHHRGRELSSS